MASSKKRPRKPKHPPPPVAHYVRPPRSGIYWKLGGPLTSNKEAEAKAALQRRPPGRVRQWATRVMGGRSNPRT
jgi:hypothetical protein